METKSEASQKADLNKKEQLSDWADKVIEEFNEVAKKHNITNMAVVFTHPETQTPAVSQLGHPYDVAKIMAAATRVLKNEINKQLET